MIHFSYVRYVLPAEKVISKLQDYKFGHNATYIKIQITYQICLGN